MFSRNGSTEYFKLDSTGWNPFGPPTYDLGPTGYIVQVDAEDGVLVEGDYSGIHITDGGAWRDVSTPDLPPSPLPSTRPASVRAVQVVSAESIFVLVEEHGWTRFDGTDFEILGEDYFPCAGASVDDLTEIDSTVAVSCPDGSGYRRTGTTWTPLPSFPEGRVFVDQHGVYAISSEGLPYLHDSTAWVPLGQRYPTPRRLFEGIADGETAPLGLGVGSSSRATEVLRWTGTGWQEVGLEGPPWIDIADDGIPPLLTSDGSFVVAAPGSWDAPSELSIYVDGARQRVDEPWRAGAIRTLAVRSSDEIHAVARALTGINNNLLTAERHYIVRRDSFRQDEDQSWGDDCKDPQALTFAGARHIVISTCPDWQFGGDPSITNALRVSDDNGATWTTDYTPTGWGFLPLGHVGQPWTGAAVFRQRPTGSSGRLLEDAWDGTLRILDDDGWRALAIPSGGLLPRRLSAGGDDDLAILGQSSLAYWDGAQWSTIEHRRLADADQGFVLTGDQLLAVHEWRGDESDPPYRTTWACQIEATTAECTSCTASPSREGSCTDGIQNGGESDVDCGGPCRSCSFGETCRQNWDCESRRCLDAPTRTCAQRAGCGDGRFAIGEQCDDGNRTGNDWCSSTCRVATCSDGTQNGDETSADTGGYCAFPEGDVCRRATTLSLERDSSGLQYSYYAGASGSYAGASNARTPSCGGDGLDQAFRLVVEEDVELRFDAFAFDDDAPTPDPDIVPSSITVSAECEGPEIACGFEDAGVFGATTGPLELSPGVYIVWIEGDPAGLADSWTVDIFGEPL